MRVRTKCCAMSSWGRAVICERMMQGTHQTAPLGCEGSELHHHVAVHGEGTEAQPHHDPEAHHHLSDLQDELVRQRICMTHCMAVAGTMMHMTFCGIENRMTRDSQGQKQWRMVRAMLPVTASSHALEPWTTLGHSAHTRVHHMALSAAGLTL